MITKDQIVAVAKTCFDPEIPVNIWDLGLIYDIEVYPDLEAVEIRMSLTSKACPAAQQIPQTLRDKVLKDLNMKDCRITLVFDPPWTTERISEEGRKKLGLAES